MSLTPLTRPTGGTMRTSRSPRAITFSVRPRHIAVVAFVVALALFTGGAWGGPSQLNAPPSVPEAPTYRVPRIAFTSDRPDGLGGNDIWVMNADGSGPLDLPGNSAFSERDPAWSPDGTKIAFVSDRPGGLGGSDIWVVNADGSNPVGLAGNSSEADFDPA